MYVNLQKVEEISTPILARNNAFLVELKYLRERGIIKYLFFIDKETNLTIEDCSTISRSLEKTLVDKGLISASDQIEVSSPGIDKPLKFLKQFPKHINKKFSITYIENEVKKTQEMKLVSVKGDILTFETNKKVEEIYFNNIVFAKTLISFKQKDN
jgi:ribosome maturation factor RimP